LRRCRKQRAAICRSSASSCPPSARVDTFTYRGDDGDLVAACRNADAILTDYVPFTAAVIRQLERCRIISVAATGWDCVDVKAAAAHGIAGQQCRRILHGGSGRPYAGADPRAESAPAGVSRTGADPQGLALERSPRPAAARRPDAGLMGFGRIGRAVCQRARAFGLEVLACDPQVDAATAAQHGARLCEFDELLASAQILSLHCNLNDSNRGLLNGAAFARMKRKPLLVNVARGGLIVEADLVRALDSGQVSGAALDVLAQESPDLEHHPLAGRADVLLTPHVAFYTEAALADLRRISAQNICAFLQGRPDDVFRLVPAGVAT
jgi:D-3-phosphoglycerate dehydrogenase